jgi:transposase
VRVGASRGPSRATFLRAVRGTPSGEPPTPRVLGVDDWAVRKGKTYGTLLVDLERHIPVEMLPDRTAQTFAAWLTRHPGVEVISRDRGGAYAEGARQGAPQAIQVADRFHLVKNLTTALETFFLHKGPALAQAASFLVSSAPPDPTPASMPSTPPSDTMYRGRRRGERRWAQRLEEASRLRHARRVALYEQIHALRAKGLEQQEIGRRLGVSRKTIIRYLQFNEPPPRRHWKQQRGRVLDRYEPYLLQRWEEGCRSGRRLWQEIRAQGYAYSLTNVARFVAQLRRAGPPPPVVQSLRGARRQAAASLTSAHGLSARQAAFLVVRPAVERSPEEAAYFDHLCHLDAEVAQAAHYAMAFVALVRERPADRAGHDGRQREVDAWIAAAQATGVAPLRRFAQGLLTDYAAVLAGLTLPINNGQLEGQVNRLKTIKRQMFGRAHFDLLRLRVLDASCHMSPNV